MKETVCIGCGRAIVSERIAVEGLDLCSVCLAPRAVRRKPLLPEYYPPLWWGAVMGALLLCAVLIGGALGHTFEALLRAVGFELFGITTALAAAVGVVVFAWRLGRTTQLLDQWWKRKTAVRLGLAHLPLERFAFAVFLISRECPYPANVGLLAETDDALVFLGRRGGMTVVPLSSIRSIDADGFCSAWWARLGLDDRSHRWILIRERGDTAWGRSSATAAFADRVRTKVLHPRFQVPILEEAVGCQATVLVGLSAATVPERIDELWKLARGMTPPNVETTRDELEESGRGLVAAALWLLLVDRGWTTDIDRRQWFLLTKDEVDLDPANLLQKLARKELSEEEWREIWLRTGVADVDLGHFAASKSKARRVQEDKPGANA